MANKEKVKSIVKDLIEQLYDAKGFNDLHCNPLERNIFEAEMQEIWDEFDACLAIDPDEREEYEEEIEDLEDRLSYAEGKADELADRNCELCEENDKLWERLKEISKVVNDTWS